MNEAKGQLPSQTSVEFVHAYNAQSHEIIDAITAMVMNSEAGVNWLHAEPPDLEGVRRALNDIVNDCKRNRRSTSCAHEERAHSGWNR